MTAIRLPGTRREMIDRLQQIDERMALAVLLGCHIVICCISLALVAPHHFTFHIFYDPVQLPVAIAAVGAFAVVAWVFTMVPFSFGYLLGFYFYTVVLGYLWLNSYSDLELRSPAGRPFRGRFVDRIRSARPPDPPADQAEVFDSARDVRPRS